MIVRETRATRAQLIFTDEPRWRSALEILDASIVSTSPDTATFVLSRDPLGLPFVQRSPVGDSRCTGLALILYDELSRRLMAAGVGVDATGVFQSRGNHLLPLFDRTFAGAIVGRCERARETCVMSPGPPSFDIV